MVSKFARLAGLLRSNVSPIAEATNSRQRVVQPVRLKSGIALSAIVCASLLILPARAQTSPTANTFSTLAGGYAGGSYTVGGVCGGASSGSKYAALDALGNGCPLTQAILGPSLSGIGADGAGNIFVEDYSNGQVRRIDAKSGIVTKVIGTSNTLCSSTPSASGTVQDSIGSGCVNGSARGPATARGMNVDSWGNVILGSYNSNMINVVCMATSPLCPGTTGRKQVGYLYRVAGCVATQGGSATAPSGVTAYTGGDNSPASPFQNLAGDVAAWGLTGTAATAATVGTAGTCSNTVGGVSSARNAQADKYGNVYIADTNGDRYRVVLGPASYNGVTNPLFAIINMNPKYTANEGYIYTILGAFSAFTSSSVTYNIPTAAGGACSSASTTITATDTLGDGCLYFETGKPSGATTPAGLGVDKDGNPIFSDTQDSAVRMLYVGGTTMANIISLNNGGLTPVVGTIYAIEGTGTAAKSSTPALNVGSSSVSTGNTKVAVDGQGNIYLSDGTGVNIIDSVTGYLRRPITTGGTLCTGGAANGDGCPASSAQTWTSLSSVGTAITVDNLGNLYLADSTGRVRKVLAGTLYPTAVGSSFSQSLIFHEPAGTTGITATLLNASPGISIPTTAPVCTLYTTASDNTADCKVIVTFAPTVAGKVGATLSITNTGGGGATTLYPLLGVATDAALVTDTASPVTSTLATFGSSGQPTSLAVDTGGNLYTVDKHALAVEQISPAGVATAVGTAPAGANQVAVDTTGNVYVTAVGAGSVTKFTLASAGGSYTSSTITNAAVAKPQGIAFDVQGNMYLSDATTASVYQVANNAGYASLAAPTVVTSGLANPTLLTFDGTGNLIIADTGVVDRVNASTGVLTTVASASAGGVVLAGLTPVGIATDAGDNIYIQDSGSKSVFEIPNQTFAPGFVTVLTGETTPSGVAVDGTGNVYVADSGLATSAVVKVVRTAETYTFPNATTVYSGTFSNTGNSNSTGYAETDTAEFPYAGSGSGGCGTVTGTSVLLTGGACTFSVTPNLGNNGLLVHNTTTLLPATSTGSLVLSAQEPSGVTYSTTTTVTGPGTAVYLGSGTEITFNVAESSTNSNSQNGESVNVTIDSGSPVAYTLSGGSVTVPVSGLTVGGHTITAVYPGDGTYLTSTSNILSFNITQASTSVAWTPGAVTQQYSAAIGSSVLNATANAAGSFIYTATPAGGAAQYIHSASYLPIGSYSLGVTFVPTDSVNYAQSTGSVASYTVTMATTTAAVGATQLLVAADGTGNYTSVQAAVNALPSGGSVYIKPGTYTGSISVVQPNIALRGLGGDPTQVILTHAGGAFGSSYPYTGEFTVAMENGYQLPTGSSQFNGDEGSATLVVAKGINTALSTTTQIPNGFYSENLTIANTYDTDTTTTTTTYEPSSNGTCTVSEGPAMTYSALYNAGTLCGSQALAIWTTSDLSVMNNVYPTSLQDTIYTASQGSGSNGYVPARQYWFRGKVIGDVDYIFGDSAAVFDNTSIYTKWHGATATGTETIHAQNKAVQTGNSSDYLSGYIMNSDVFTSQSTGMTNLYFGRPYGTYSTWIMLNSYVDQVNPLGYTTGLGPTLTPTTFGEFNDQLYTDPAANSADLNGVLYLGTGGNVGAGVAGVREAASTNPGTSMANNGIPTTMTQAQAQAYFPTNFLSRTVSALLSSTQNWNPTAAIAAAVNAFVPSGSLATVASGTSITILMRPQTPGLGAISNGLYTIPTGTYTLTDSYSGTNTTLASGSLDASGEAYLTTSTLPAGTHNITMMYSGDSNFSASTTATPYVLTVTASGTTVPVISIQPAANATYGIAASVAVTVSPVSGSVTPTGQILLSVDGGTAQAGTLSGAGTHTFTLSSSLSVGSHSLSVTYTGDNTFASISSNSATVTVAQVAQTIAFNDSLPASVIYSSGLTYTISATGGGSGNAVTFSAAGPATLTGSSLVITGSGTVTITANQAGNANYADATQVTQSIVVNQVAQTINFTAPASPVSYGIAPITLSATGGASGNAVVFSVVSGPATVSGSTLTITGAGTVVVAANQAGNTNYAAPTQVTQSIVVNQASQTITFTQPTSPVTYGVSPITLSATGGASSNAVVFSVVSGPATVSGSTLTITGAGTVVVAANQAGNTNYAAPTQVTQSIVVNAASQTITFTAPTSPVSYGVSAITLSATGGASGNAVVFSVVSGPATVSGSTLTITGAGTVVVAANQAGNTNYAAPTQVTQSIVVNAASQTITFTAPTSPVTYGVSPITLSASSTSGLAVTFSVVSGPATVSGSTLTITGVGTVVIAANQAGNTNYSAATLVTQSIVVNVIGAAATPTFSPVAGTYTAAQTVSISDATTGATIYYTTNGTTPTTSSTVYSTAIPVASTETLEAIATATGYTTSAVASAAYILVNPLPAIGGISPAFTNAGGTVLPLTVNGSGFIATSTVYWGASALTTTYVSATQLTAQVPAADIATAGTIAITVQSPAPGGGTSNAWQFEVDSASSGAFAPTITSTTETVAAGSTASYPVTVPPAVTSVSVTCLNLPAGATCSYSSTTNAVTITTSPTTPKGTYQIIVVFTETISGAAPGFILLPILLLPLGFMRRKLAARGIWLTACLGLVLMAAAAVTLGCGGGPATPPATHQVTNSGAVSLTVQ